MICILIAQIWVERETEQLVCQLFGNRKAGSAKRMIGKSALLVRCDRIMDQRPDALFGLSLGQNIPGLRSNDKQMPGMLHRPDLLRQDCMVGRETV